MKQKTKPQPLNLKKIHEVLMKEGDNEFTKVVKVEDIKSACEFYLRYKDKPELFCKEHFEIDYYKFNDEWFITSTKSEGVNYNDWLFKLAFKDIFKEK